jgi:hypothetical protein
MIASGSIFYDSWTASQDRVWGNIVSAPDTRVAHLFITVQTLTRRAVWAFAQAR